MKYLLALQTWAPGAALACSLVLAMNGSLLAQTTGAVNSKPDVDPSRKDEPAAGDCMPIGITASGEVVFPLPCRDFIERLKAADRKPVASEESHVDASAKPAVGEVPVVMEEKPAVTEEKTVAVKEETTAIKEKIPGPDNSKAAEKPLVKAPIENRDARKWREQAAGPFGCTRFRSYDPSSGTYRSYDGRRLSCRVVDHAAMVK